jgi:CubicO group peptidase (beta-lactamase class C family)
MDITHEPYDKYMRDNVLRPLGMMSSFYTQPAPADKRGLLATAYHVDGKAVEGKYHIYPEEAPAGLWTNPTDLCQYIIETQNSYAGLSAKVLSQEYTRLRLTPYIDSTAALGVFINKIGAATYFQHGGANEGFRCQYYGSLEGGNGVVVMVNSDNGGILQEVVNSVAIVYAAPASSFSPYRQRANSSRSCRNGMGKRSLFFPDRPLLSLVRMPDSR